MKNLFSGALLLLLLLQVLHVYAQKKVSGKVVDGTTKEAIPGATIKCAAKECGSHCMSSASGEFTMHCNDCQEFSISSVGYSSVLIKLSAYSGNIFEIYPVHNELQQVVVSANRGEAVKRSLAPVAISVISNRLLQDTKPISADQVLNKVSGVNMVNLGNEQHQMSIRQPMTTKSLFLYLEDGIPIRTTGLFNHNALLEMNMAAVKSIEVIKGPSSSLYGSEAIGGVVNFITLAPTAIPVLKVGAQLNNIGYKRTDLGSSFQKGKWGFALSGYYASKTNSYLEYSDFHKATVTARIDYAVSDKTKLVNSATWLDYYSDMSGSIDSAMFASRSFKNLQTFTYRKVKSFRYRSTLSHNWSDRGKTSATLLFRKNAIGQNPAYRVKDDYRRQGNVFVGKKDLAHGEINESSFRSYSVIVQHKQDFSWKKAVLMAGASIDISPSRYDANYIRIKKDTLTKKYINYEDTDSVLTNYNTRLNNYAAFLNFEFNPLEKLRIVTSLRYDLFNYGFNNHLRPSSFSGSPDTSNRFHRFSPKIGFTYNFGRGAGIYANYSEGFVPPQVSELYTGVKVPQLKPSTFYNYEAGAWLALFRGKLTADLSIYQLEGTNEIISVKLDDGSFANQNAGKTSHKGIELGINASPNKSISLRFGGAYSFHRFVDFTEKGVKYDGNEMNNAPRWMHNTEIWYKPLFAKGLRVGMEWQHIGSYYADAKNTARYNGYDVIHLRVGYQLKGMEFWVNLMNVADNYYSYITSKSAFGYSYQLAEPRNFNLGISYDFGNLLKKQ